MDIASFAFFSALKGRIVKSSNMKAEPSDGDLGVLQYMELDAKGEIALYCAEGTVRFFPAGIHWMSDFPSEEGEDLIYLLFEEMSSESLSFLARRPDGIYPAIG